MNIHIQKRSKYYKKNNFVREWKYRSGTNDKNLQKQVGSCFRYVYLLRYYTKQMFICKFLRTWKVESKMVDMVQNIWRIGYYDPNSAAQPLPIASITAALHSWHVVLVHARLPGNTKPLQNHSTLLFYLSLPPDRACIWLFIRTIMSDINVIDYFLFLEGSHLLVVE